MSRINSRKNWESRTKDTTARWKITTKLLKLMEQMEDIRVGRKSISQLISNELYLFKNKRVSNRVVWINQLFPSQLNLSWIIKSNIRMIFKVGLCPNHNFGSSTIGPRRPRRWSALWVVEKISMAASCPRSKLTTMARLRRTSMLGVHHAQRPSLTGQPCGMVVGILGTVSSSRTWASMRVNSRLAWSKIIGAPPCPFAPCSWVRIEANSTSSKVCSRAQIASRRVIILCLSEAKICWRLNSRKRLMFSNMACRQASTNPSHRGTH